MRLVFASWWLQLRLLSRSPFFLGMAILTPIAYGTIMVLMAGEQASLRTIIGSGLMGAWSAVLFGAAEALLMQRYTGTLELLIGAPRSLIAPVLGFAAATVTLGLYSLVAAWAWTTLVLRMGLRGAGMVSPEPLAVLLALASVLLSLLALAVLLAGFYVLSRKAMELSNLLGYPIWILCGVSVSAAVLWPPLAALGRLLPLGWAMAAVDEAVAGRSPLLPVLLAGLLSLAYLVLGGLLLRRVDMLARIRGTLMLW